MKLSNNMKFGLAVSLLVIAIGLLANSLWIIKNDTSLEDFQAALQQQLQAEISQIEMAPAQQQDQVRIHNPVPTEYKFDNTFEGMALLYRPPGTGGMKMVDMSKATFRVIVNQGSNGSCTQLKIKTDRGYFTSECILGTVQHK